MVNLEGWVEDCLYEAQLLTKRGDLSGAIKLYRFLIALKPEEAVLYHCLGLALAHSGEYDSAIKAYESSLRLDPHNRDAAYWYLNIGVFEDERGNYEAAEAAWHEALARDSTLLTAKMNLAKLKAERNFVEEAIRLLTEIASSTEPEDAPWVEEAVEMLSEIKKGQA